jgi:toxin-antitoxin system PIN domain toxin
VKLIDANLLLYAVDESSPQHDRARGWLEAVLSGTQTVAFSWSVLLAFLRLSTRPQVFANPLTADEALDIIDGWLAQPTAVIIHPTDRHAALLRDLLRSVGTAGNLTTDAHLAALSIEHGATLCSADADFSRFVGLARQNPLSD